VASWVKVNRIKQTYQLQLSSSQLIRLGHCLAVGKFEDAQAMPEIAAIEEPPMIEGRAA
jgi:hypothetical protein